MFENFLQYDGWYLQIALGYLHNSRLQIQHFAFA
jgi:hypothetical protein